MALGTFSNLSCPLGHICYLEENTTHKTYLTTSCDEIQRRAIEDFKFGDVLGGIYCPENSSGISFCSVGYFCPNTTAMLPCPSGFYCPHKTRIPEISCPSCPEGSVEMKQDQWGYFVVVPIVVIVLLSLLQRFARQNTDKLRVHLAKRSNESSKINESKEMKIQQRMLRSLLPQLEILQEKLKNDQIVSQDENGHIFFDVELLFDTVNITNSENLTFDDLKQALDLKQGQILEFLKVINELGCMAKGETSVTKPVFVQFFLEALDHASNFDPSDKQAGQLFDQILKDLGTSDDIAVDTNMLHGSCLCNFLSETEIHMLITKFHRVLSILNSSNNSRRQSSIFGSSSNADSISKRISNFSSRRSSGRPYHSRRSSGMPNRNRRSSAVALENDVIATREGLTIYERIFLQCMLDLIQHSESFDPSYEDMPKLITEILDDLDFHDSGVVDTEALPLAIDDFLDAKDIEILKARYMKTVKMLDTTESDNPSTSSSRRKERKKSLYVIKNEPKRELTKDIFCQFYGIFLKEIKRVRKLQQASERDVVDLSFEDLSLAVQVEDKTRFIVNNVTGIIKGKAMTAILGGSGAGKTSLLNALCGRAYYGDVTGQIYINGQSSSIDEHKSIVGFVPQDDTVYPELTVRENLMFAGRFQLPGSTEIKDIEESTDETIASLGLTRVANSIVGDESTRGISGGEKKRVNIGVELMSRPGILFLDEPTSGLDANSAMLVMKSLQELVNSNSMTICCVIHQPRKQIFELFDSLILLGVGGNMVYHGPVDKVENYFNSLKYSLPADDNVADWLLDVSTGYVVPDIELSCDHSNSRSDTNALTEQGKGRDDELVTGEFTRIAENMLTNSMNLSRSWNQYFKHDSNNEPFSASLLKRDLPSQNEKPGFFHQMFTNIHRNVIVSVRQKENRLINMFLLMGAVWFMSWLDGTVEVTYGATPSIHNEYFVLTSKDPDQFSESFEELFKYVTESMTVQSYALKVGILISILFGVTAASNVTDKQIEFFREAAAGYNVNSYFMALHITTLMEYLFTIFVVSLLSFWLRNSFSDGLSFILNYIFLTWVVLGWGFIFPFLFALESVSIMTALFMAFVGIQFSGQLEPITFKEMYNSASYGVFSGIICPIRYFTEQMLVTELRTLPSQSGVTKPQGDAGMNFPTDKGALEISGIALLDVDTVMMQSTSGWYWPFLRVFMVGLSLRLLSFALLHMVNRPQQNKKPILSKLKWQQGTRKALITALIGIASFGVSLFLTIYLILK